MNSFNISGISITIRTGLRACQGGSTGCTILYYIILYYTVVYCSILYYPMLYCTILYCTILYYTITY